MCPCPTDLGWLIGAFHGTDFRKIGPLDLEGPSGETRDYRKVQALQQILVLVRRFDPRCAQAPSLALVKTVDKFLII